MVENPFKSSSHHHEDHWIPLSDLMTGLMMVFLFIAITYMIKVDAATYKIKQIAIRYDQLHTDLYIDLQKEFKNDLPKWGAELHKDLSVRFKEPDVLFDTGSDRLKPKFMNILNDFFPRYIAILFSDKYKNSIREIRIEGHTSSVWNDISSSDDAYFKNMELSQARTRSTLQYVLTLPTVQNKKDWLRQLLTANGLSSSKLIYDKNGKEDSLRSQRVEFRVRTDAESRIATIIEASKK
ncbi:MAG: OmpA/MotB family protein [Leptospirales bacterium]